MDDITTLTASKTRRTAPRRQHVESHRTENALDRTASIDLMDRTDRTATQRVRNASHRNASASNLVIELEHLVDIIHGRTTNTPATWHTSLELGSEGLA